MLKKTASFVLGSSKASTYPRGYASGFDLPAALPAERRVLAHRGWAGENRSLFEHPARCSPIVLDVWTNRTLTLPRDVFHRRLNTRRDKRDWRDRQAEGGNEAHSFRNFEPRISSRALLARLALHAPRSRVLVVDSSMDWWIATAVACVASRYDPSFSGESEPLTYDHAGTRIAFYLEQTHVSRS